MRAYNQADFVTDPVRWRRLTGPEPGAAAPEIEATSPEGAPLHLRDFLGKGPVVLEFGCLTCPQYLAGISRMRRVARRFPEAVFLVVYTREMYPGEAISPHRSIEEKRRNALQLRNEEGEDRAILVDRLGGNGHLAYGGLPNALYVLDRRGVVVHRAPWADPDDVALVLDAMDRGKPPPTEGLTTPRPALLTLRRTLRRAGRPVAAGYARVASRLLARRLRRTSEE